MLVILGYAEWREMDVFYHQIVFACGGAGAGKGDHWELHTFACEVMYILGGDPGPQHLVNRAWKPKDPLAYGSLAEAQGRKKLKSDHLLCAGCSGIVRSVNVGPLPAS